jgi:hypothetical protein
VAQRKQFVDLEMALPLVVTASAVSQSTVEVTSFTYYFLLMPSATLGDASRCCVERWRMEHLLGRPFRITVSLLLPMNPIIEYSRRTCYFGMQG